MFLFPPQSDLAKSVITLQPPWVSVFPGESVTLRCEGPHLPWDNSTKWFLNGTAIETLTASYNIMAASVDDSGEYTCQRGLSERSDPVYLEVRRGKYGMEQEHWKLCLPLYFFLFGSQMSVRVCVCVDCVDLSEYESQFYVPIKVQ